MIRGTRRRKGLTPLCVICLVRSRLVHAMVKDSEGAARAVDAKHIAKIVDRLRDANPGYVGTFSLWHGTVRKRWCVPALVPQQTTGAGRGIPEKPCGCGRAPASREPGAPNHSSAAYTNAWLLWVSLECVCP